MLDVKTPLSKIHRTTRRIATGFAAVPGSWAYIASTGVLTNVVSTSTNQTQPKVLKCVMGNASTNTYESNDIAVGSIATLETVFRAAVDSNGYATAAAAGTSLNNATYYPQGQELTVAYLVTSTATGAGLQFSATADIGKLRPVVTNGEVVVARVEGIDATNSVLTFETVTPYLMSGL